MAKAKKAAPKKAAVKKAVPAKAKVVAAPKAANNKSTGSMPNPIFNIHEINDLINAVNHSNVNELKLEKGDFKITIRQGGVVSTQQTVVQAAAPVMQQVAAAAPVAAAPVAAAPVADTPSENVIMIKSPMIGTFYRSSGPGKPVFVNVGDEIKVGQVLCIVEAMKLFNEIESEVSGRIVKVLIDDSSPVEYDQPLFLVESN